MSEKDNKNVRRFGRRDQKESIPKPNSLFPAEESDVESEAIDFDIDSLGLPDTNSEALEMLSSLQDEVKAPIITPREERYPPIAPVSKPVARPKSAPETIAPKKRENNFLKNILTIFFLLATLANIIWFVLVWNDPQSALNPLPPATPYIVVTIPPNSTPNTGETIIHATPDESGQIFVIITDTPMPTVASTSSPFPFIAESVLYAPNSNELACNWWSIAGTVSDIEGNPLSGYRVRIKGEDVNESVFSGASQAFGDGGYELPLIGTPREAAFIVQLFTPQDAPLSDEISVRTRADCESNVAIINFIQNR